MSLVFSCSASPPSIEVPRISWGFTVFGWTMVPPASSGFAVLDNPDVQSGFVNFGAAVAFATGNAHVMVSVSAERFPAEFLVVKLGCEFFAVFLDRVALPLSKTVGGRGLRQHRRCSVIEETKKAISLGNFLGGS